ncbi:hypothetical protein Plhal304r1_c052g0136671 [Plasmopara halstedii]
MHLLNPVFKVFLFRLAFHLLPVRSKLWCDAIETEQPLSFNCTFLSHLWWQVLELVSPLFVERPTWLDIALTNYATADNLAKIVGYV